MGRPSCKAAALAASKILSPLVLVSTLGCEIVTEYIRSMASPGFEDYEGAPEPRPFESVVGILGTLFEQSRFELLAALTGLLRLTCVLHSRGELLAKTTQSVSGLLVMLL